MDTNSELLKLIEWSAVHANIHIGTQSQFPRKKQIWWASLGQNIGVEINGKNNRFERPVLIIKVLNVNSLFVAPITSTIDKNNKYLIEFDSFGNRKSINISQLRTLSAKRFSRKMSDLSDIDFERVLNTIQKHVLLIKTEAPQSGASSNSINME